MSDQHRYWQYICGIIGGLVLGFFVGRITAPAPTIEDGLYFNGKRVDPAKLGVPLPGVPKSPDGGKKKPGDLPAGELGPAASHKMHNIDQQHVVKNQASKVDQLGLNVPACLETMARSQGYGELNGFLDYCARFPGGHYPSKTMKQFMGYVADKGSPSIDLVINDANMPPAKLEELDSVISENGPVMIAYQGTLDNKHYSNRKVCTALVLNGYNQVTQLYSVVDPNFPDDLAITLSADKVKQHTEWYAYFVPSKQKPAANADSWMLNLAASLTGGGNREACSCGSSCLVCTCHAHAAKPIVYRDDLAHLDSDDQLVVVGQRGGSQKPVEAFGIETLVQVLKDLKEALFGDKSKGQPGLRDDIANGMKDFYASLRTGVLVGGVLLLAFMVWVGLNVQRIADSQARRVV